MLRYFTKVRVGADTCDVHVRTQSCDCGWVSSSIRATQLHAPSCAARTPFAFCGVYVHPVGPVPGYWYFPVGDDARTILRALGAA